MLRYRPPPLLTLGLGMVSPLPASSFSSNPNLITFSPSFPIFKFPHRLPSLLTSFLSTLQNHTPTMPCFRCTFSGSIPAIPVPTACDAHEPDALSLVVVSFYKFAGFPDHAQFRQPLKNLCEDLRVSGGIILAPEGINGSICGTQESVQRVLEFIESDDRLKGLRKVETPVSPEEEAIHHGHTSSSPLAAGEDAPFRWDHVRVKLKKEIVTLGMPVISPVERVGKYVKPREWNELISDPDTVVIDVRNHYETRIGKFKRAVDPCTTAFRDFPSWVEDKFQLSQSDSEHSNEGIEDYAVNPEQNVPPRVAMYCTGGIRCEKASSYLLSKGFKEVYHLEGGILKYLEEVPKTESLWEGECFVFDKRVSVEHGLEQGTFKLCYGCKQPVDDADMESPKWEYGVSCPHCYSTKSEEEKERARARQRQFETWGIIGGPDKGRRPNQSGMKFLLSPKLRTRLHPHPINIEAAVLWSVAGTATALWLVQPFDWLKKKLWMEKEKAEAEVQNE